MKVEILTPDLSIESRIFSPTSIDLADVFQEVETLFVYVWESENRNSFGTGDISIRRSTNTNCRMGSRYTPKV